MLDEDRYREALTTRWAGRHWAQLETVDSTNLELKRTPLSNLVNGSLLIAEAQQAGRGQKGRKWRSEPGLNLTFSLALRPVRPTCRERLSLLSLLAGLAVIQTTESIAPESAWQIKWPNDVLAGGKKVAGILTEVTFLGNRLDRIIIGIGINVNQTRFDEQLSNATSLYLESGAEQTRETVLAGVMNRFEPLYERWRDGDESLPARINERLRGVGCEVGLTVDGLRLPEPCKFLGADLQGHLHFLTPDLTLKSFRHEQIRIDPLA